MARHIRKGDQVMVICGNERHRRNPVGRVLRVIRGATPNQDRVIVEGFNIRRKHVRPDQKNPQGGVIDKEMPIHISNVVPVEDAKPTRVRFETRDDGSKVRIAVRTGKQIGSELRKARG